MGMENVLFNRMDLRRSASSGAFGRRRRHLRSLAYGAALAAMVATPVTAWSGEIYAPPPPSPTKVVDINGVNLIAGAPSPPMPSISTAGLSETMGNIGVSWQSRVTDYNDSFTGYIADKDRSSSSINDAGNAAIVIGGKTHQLDVDIFAGGCANSICTYWDKDGVAYLFDGSKQSDPFDGIAGKLGMLVQINRPDGETVKITLLKSSLVFTTPGSSNSAQYTVHNVAVYYPFVVVSSTGWMAKYEYTTRTYGLSTPSNIFTAYVPQKIYLINTAVDYCDPAAASCTSSNAARWPTWSITYPNVFKDVSNTPIGSYWPEGFTLPSGVANNYWFASQTHRVTDAFVNGRHTVYGYNWATGTAGTAPYIITATKPDGATYSARSEKFNYQYSNTVLNDFTYFYLDQPSQFTDENGRVTKYEYNSDDNAYRADNRSLKRVISPEATYSGAALTGGYTQYGYDARRNVTSVSVYPKTSGAPLVTQYEYEASCTSINYRFCNKPKKITDPNGNITEFVYAQEHGGLLTERRPADGYEVRYTYALRTPRVRDSSTALVSSTPVYRLTQISSCSVPAVGTPPSCIGTPDEKVTEYEYYLDQNLLLKSETVRAGNANAASPYSSSNVWQTVSYEYDLVGNRISTDGPLPGAVDKAYATYDVRRRPVFEIGVDPDGSGPLKRQVIRHKYDLDNREVRTETGFVNNSDGPSFSYAAFDIADPDQAPYTWSTAKRMTYDAAGQLTLTEVVVP
jgi:hypothetical protein